MRSPAQFVVAAFLLVSLGCPVVRADGGRLMSVERHGDWRIYVFTSPNPLRAGPIDISVLIENAETDRPIVDMPVQITLTSRATPTRTIHAAATTEAATNKLLRAALVELPVPGWWDVEVICRAERNLAHVQFAVDAGPPLPRWLTVWPWFCWPVGAVALFAVHRLLVWRGQSARHLTAQSNQNLGN